MSASPRTDGRWFESICARMRRAALPGVVGVLVCTGVSISSHAAGDGDAGFRSRGADRKPLFERARESRVVSITRRGSTGEATGDARRVVIGAASTGGAGGAGSTGEPGESGGGGGDSPGQFEPLYTYTWFPLSINDPTIVPMVWFRHLADWEYDRVVRELAAQPEGHRVLFSYTLHQPIFWNELDESILWADHGRAEVEQKLDQFFREIKQRGAEVDYLILDEEACYSNWHFLMQAEERGDDPSDLLDAVMSDSRWPALLEELGPEFEDPNVIFNIREHADLVLRWNSVVEGIRRRHIEEAIIAPFHRYYPDAKFSNWECGTIQQAEAPPDKNGWRNYFESPTLGGIMAFGFYGGTRLIHTSGSPLPDRRHWAPSPYRAVLFCGQFARGLIRSNPDEHAFHPWLTTRSLPTRLSDSPYYLENLRVTLAHGADAAIYWNHHGATRDEELQYLAVARELSDHGVVDAQLLTRDRIDWLAEAFVTGFDNGVAHVYRVTMDQDVVGLKYRVNGQLRVAEPDESGTGCWLVFNREDHIEWGAPIMGRRGGGGGAFGNAVSVVGGRPDRR